MPVSIPESVFDKYYDVVDSTFAIFGVTCQLVYVETVEEISNTYNNIPENRSINAQRRGQEAFKRQDKIIKQVEKTEDIKLKVYWDSRSFVKPGGDIVVPDNSIQTIFFASDIGKIVRAKELIVHKDIKDIKEMRFQRAGEPFPMGLRQNRYFGCFWGRVP
jgi:hypothetical protein